VKPEALQVLAPNAAWPPEAVDAVERLLRRVVDLRRENDQLQTALESRVVIEQAKGVLAERHLLPPDYVFQALRAGARSNGRRLHDVAQEVLASQTTPPCVMRELERRVTA
jgi:AmiR/NasT family two-component response regulator